MEKKNFPLYTRVQFVFAIELTGKTGTIIGRSVIDVDDHYIVLLDCDIEASYGLTAAVVITEHCLEQINDFPVKGIQLF